MSEPTKRKTLGKDTFDDSGRLPHVEEDIAVPGTYRLVLSSDGGQARKTVAHVLSVREIEQVATVAQLITVCNICRRACIGVENPSDALASPNLSFQIGCLLLIPQCSQIGTGIACYPHGDLFLRLR